MLEDVNNIKKDIQEYFEVRFDLLRLHTAENLAWILSSAATLTIIGYLLFFILLFLSFAAGYFFASILDSYESGFLCVAGFYFIILVIFLIFRRQIIERPIIKAIVKLFFPKFSDDEKAQ
jgi:hypothetical protein